MKKTRLLLAVLLLLASTCSKDETDLKTIETEEETEIETTLKRKLVGTWVEIIPCDGCYIFTFSNDGNINWTMIYDKTHTINNLSYKILSEDSIQVTRNYEIDEERKTTKHKVDFISNDTIKIHQFLAVDVGITGFEDVTLIKSN